MPAASGRINATDMEYYAAALVQNVSAQLSDVALLSCARMLSALEKRCHNQSRSSSSVLLSPARIVDEHMNGSCFAT